MPNYATLVQALLAAFCAILCALSGMGGGGMMIGARTAAWAKSGYTAKDYVQDGLVSMWDGIENAGWGVHDPNATVWKNLAGDFDHAVLTEVGAFDSNSLVCSGGERSDGLSKAAALINGGLYYNTIPTMEIVFKLTSAWGRGGTTGTQGPQFVFMARTNNANSRANSLVFGGTGTSNFKRLSINAVNISGTSYKKTRVKDDWRYNKYSLHYEFGDGHDLNSTPTKYVENGAEFELTAFTRGDGRESMLTSSGFGGRDTIYGMSGHIYAVRFYDRLMTESEIAANCEIDKARFNLT